MPTYQYRCTACSRDLEVVQKFSDAPLTKCPECRGRLRKVFSPVGVVFKGSGFYSTDSRSTGRSTGPAPKPEHAGESAHTGDASPHDHESKRHGDKGHGQDDTGHATKADTSSSSAPSTKPETGASSAGGSIAA